MYNLNPSPIRPAQQQGTGVVLGSSIAYLRKVYALFGGGILFAIAGAMVRALCRHSGRHRLARR